MGYQESATLKAGSQAPEFTLASANWDGLFRLGALLERGPLIVEFLRGTW